MFGKRKARPLSSGEKGERQACRYLRFRGYRILERNYRCPPGEIDIVAGKRDIIVFVEVRTRKAGALVDPLASISDLKTARFVDAARHYLTARRTPNAASRFDIITVSAGRLMGTGIVHYPDAFQITDTRVVRGRRLKAWIRRQPRPGKGSLRK